MSFSELVRNGFVLMDGGMGTLLCSMGLRPGEHSESWNLTRPDDIVSVHRAYMDAGSNIVTSNTFGVNTLVYSFEEADALVGAAFDALRRAKEETTGEQEILFAMDIGPLGRLLEPFGDLSFESARSAFADAVKLGVKHGADIILIETFTDLNETKAALLAAKENCSLPVIVSNAYNKDGRLLTGARPEAVIAMLESMGADAVGMNCSFGPEMLAPIAEVYLSLSSLPVLFQPNAGLPETTPEGVRYSVGAAEFAADVADMVRKGVRLAGGCCGTGPEYISLLREMTATSAPKRRDPSASLVVTSRAAALDLADTETVIGERISYSFGGEAEQAIREGDTDFIFDEAEEQEEDGAQILTLNVGASGADEAAVLTDAIKELQMDCELPLQIETADPAALEAALRVYIGKPMIRLTGVEKTYLEAVFPLIKKYGGLVNVPLPEGDAAAAGEILRSALSSGVAERDILFTLPVGEENAAERIAGELGRPVGLVSYRDNGLSVLSLEKQ